LLSGIDLPVACIPGNHDVRALMREALSDAPFCYCPDLHIGNWLLASVDSCVTGQAGGYVDSEELQRFEDTVRASDAEHIAVFLHHPPADMDSRWLDSVGLENADEVLARLQSDERIHAAVFGHVHQPYDKEHGTVRVIGTPSTCRQFKPGSDEFAVDDRPPAYRKLTLMPDGRVETDLVWIDAN
jgi:Icc protein